MAETQINGIPIEDLQEASQSDLTDSTKMVVEDSGTPITRQCKLGVMADWINDKIDVGGRNLLQNTRDLLNWNTAGLSIGTDADGLAVAVFPNQSSLTLLSAIAMPNLPYLEVKNREVTISFMAKASKIDTTSGYNGKPAITLGIATSASGEKGLYTRRYTDILTTEWKKHSITLTITDDIFDTGSGKISNKYYLSVAFEHYSLTGAQFKGFKMEYGNVATDWNLSDDDLVEATTTKAGLMSATDKTILDDLSAHAIDAKYWLSGTSSDADLIVRVCSKIVNASSNNYTVLMTLAEMAELLGVEESSLDNARVHVSCLNGDGVANGIHITSVDWWGGTYKSWYAYLSASTSADLRINFLVVYAKPK